MTQAGRVALNTAVSYSRSLLALFLGLFSARWVLNALGQQDYGLYGVVGSLLISISFLNITLSGSVSRFYAFAIGSARKDSPEASEHDLRGWFNAAIVIHCGLGLILVGIGLPLGEYAIRNILSIPLERIEACIWVLRISVFSSLIGLVAVPYCAFYTAYQYIAELTVFDMLRTLLNFLGAYFLLSVKSDRLIAYSIMMATFSVFITLVQLWRARFQFPVRMSLRYFHIELSRVKEVLRYGALKLMGVLGWLFKAHGSAFVINLNFTPNENAAYSVANQVVLYSTSLASAMVNAITPALTTFAGAGDIQKVQSYTVRVCKYSGFLVALFAAPLICDIDYVLEIWLDHPPLYCSNLCGLFLVSFLVDTMSVGCMTAISTETRIGRWQSTESFILVAAIPILYICYKSNLAFVTIGYVFVMVSILIVCERLYFCKCIIGVSPFHWFRHVLIPIGAIFILGCLLGGLIKECMPQTFLRLIIVAATTSFTIVSLFLAFAADSVERQLMLRFINKLWMRVAR